MTIVAIDHVQLAIPPDGADRARAFYGDVMGFREIPKPPTMRAGIWYDAGPIAIHLGFEEDMRPSAKMHPAFVVTDLDGWQRRLVAAGHEWREGTDLPGVRRGHTKDPFGNRIELIER